ncbi:unnamed protein product [Urochloa humidicola]
MADDAASSPPPPATAAVTEEAANRPMVAAATTDGSAIKPHPPATMDECSTSAGESVPLNGKRQRGDTDDCLAKADGECDEKKAKIDETVPVPSGLLARRAGFVPHHLKVDVPEYKLRHFIYDSDCESTDLLSCESIDSDRESTDVLSCESI